MLFVLATAPFAGGYLLGHADAVGPARSPIESLLPIFDAGHVAIVVDKEKFLGLITRIDLLNYLRRRVH